MRSWPRHHGRTAETSGLRSANPPNHGTSHRPAPVDPVTADETIEELDRRLALVETRLTTAAGDRSLCELSRAGETDGIKDLEGRMSALRDARRAVRTSEARSVVAIAAALDVWRAELVTDSRRGPVWRSYRAGGIDELQALVCSLERGARVSGSVVIPPKGEPAA